MARTSEAGVKQHHHRASDERSTLVVDQIDFRLRPPSMGLGFDSVRRLNALCRIPIDEIHIDRMLENELQNHDR